ncbi:MAG TPA: ABC transporter permease [Symbiobacteriaceae bacterium]|nr:ABC transporter permease [Symbiobacteriaceae bacterium]
MRQSLIIAMLHLKQSFKSKGTLISVFGLPLIMTFVFGVMLNASSGRAAHGHVYPVAVVDLDDSFASRSLVETLKQEPNLAVVVTTEAGMNKRFADKKIDSGVVIPKGFHQGIVVGSAPEVKLIAAPGSNLVLGMGPLLRRDVARMAHDYRLAIAVAGGVTDETKVNEQFARISEDRKNNTTIVTMSQVARQASAEVTAGRPVDAAAIGFIITFVMMAVFMMSGVILQERRQGTWPRLLTTPQPRLTLISGYLLSFFLTGLAQFAILVVVSRLVFGVDWGPLLPLAAMASATVLCAGGMGLFLAGIVKTYEQQVTVGVLVINATSMLGGVYWDLSWVSQTMQRIGYLTPQAWALDGFREVMLRGGAWSGLLLPLAVLLGITAVFMTAGIVRIRYE